MALLGYTLLVISKSITLVIGFFIVLLTFLSYRRHKHKIMLNISIGFALITFGSVIEGIMYEFLRFDLLLDHIVESVFILLGMIIIAYSLFFGGDEIE